MNALSVDQFWLFSRVWANLGSGEWGGVCGLVPGAGTEEVTTARSDTSITRRIDVENGKRGHHRH